MTTSGATSGPRGGGGHLFVRTADGVVVDLDPIIRQVIGDQLGRLRQMIEKDEDASLRRLYPTAHPADSGRDAEYQQLAHDGLRSARLDAIDVVAGTLDADLVDDDQLTAWMQATNSLRLVLGTILDVSESERLRPDDPEQAAMVATYELLTLLVGDMVQALEPTLEDPR